MPGPACVYESIDMQEVTFMRAFFHARILVLIAIAVVAGCVGVPDGIEPVTGFQVERYMAAGTKWPGSITVSNAAWSRSRRLTSCGRTARWLS